MLGMKLLYYFICHVGRMIESKSKDMAHLHKISAYHAIEYKAVKINGRESRLEIPQLKDTLCRRLVKTYLDSLLVVYFQ